MKKGQTWISTVLYMGIGIAIITVILAAGMPLITKIKDENIVSQTKDLMANLDETIRKVNEEGPGSRRILSVEIKKGNMKIDAEKETITWEMDTNAIVSELGVEIAVGSITMLEKKEPGKSENTITLALSYKKDLDKILDIKEDSVANIIGRYNLIIANEGSLAGTKINQISIKSQ